MLDSKSNLAFYLKVKIVIIVKTTNKIHKSTWPKEEKKV